MLVDGKVIVVSTCARSLLNGRIAFVGFADVTAFVVKMLLWVLLSPDTMQEQFAAMVSIVAVMIVFNFMGLLF